MDKINYIHRTAEMSLLINPKQHKKGYQLRYGNFQKAWNFVEAHLKVAIENYSKSVEHIQKLLEEHRKGLHE